MNLPELLSCLLPDQLERLNLEHIHSEEQLSRPMLLNMLEGTLRSFGLVQDLIARRHPPAFAILCTLLDSADHQVLLDTLEAVATRDTERLCDLVTSGEILGRDDQLRLYRHVLHEARRSDLLLDSSESALLGVLRRELGIAPVEHFLIDHHADLQEFWRQPGAFRHELHSLTSVGLIFLRDSIALVADDVAPLIRQALGIDLPRSAARRLFSALSSSAIADALDRIGVRTGGSKDDRIERLILNWAQPRFVLRPLPIGFLREFCRQLDAPTYGTKDELIERIISRYLSGADAPAEPEPAPAPIAEDRLLDESRFKLLFGSLRGSELADILYGFPMLKQSGSKDGRGLTLWNSHRSEFTLLSTLRNRDLEAVLLRLDLKLGSPKAPVGARSEGSVVDGSA